MAVGFGHRTLCVLCTADDTSLAIADDLLRCDWLGRTRLIITRAVSHLAIATSGKIGRDAIRAVWSRVIVSQLAAVTSVPIRANRRNAK